MGLTDLAKEETEALAVNIRNVEMALHKFWSIRFRDDSIERLYVGCFSEARDLHLNFHLIPPAPLKSGMEIQRNTPVGESMN
jgi:hypothetical protein